ncbi:glyoxalase superfamily protein [Mucilaginibacter sp. RS28]|uniref:Bleomycin resistance protein n=1 Tax=Mucilaginibacter straminoryzae TaxID=2932774 RepID=A0A9X1X5P1_9SPHI|nr:glyoxalase superfamily protein [Mucilaginibacter straminoryzae]MCJ8211436.1 glyoxalase superfamily protein [Mucilaginibacter straminoryzae]
MPTVIPILRFYSYEKTIEFYVNWLGFKIEWEHRFHDNAPVFMQLAKNGVILNLSEHHGDGTPGTHVRVSDYKGLRAWHSELIEAKYKYNRPGLDVPEWAPDSINMTVTDPCNNQITFEEREKPTDTEQEDGTIIQPS